jgi:nitroreductase
MIQATQLNELIEKRRSTFPKQFDPEKKVADSIIEQMLKNANWAPNHKHTEPWRFTVFTGAGLERLANFQAEQYKKIEAATFKQEKYEKLLSNPLRASHIISIGFKRSEKVPEIEEVAAVSCAVQNMYLTAAAYGVGAYWTTGGVTYYPGVNYFFGLDEKDKLLGFFYVGVIATASPAGKRNPIEEKVNWIRQ